MTHSYLLTLGLLGVTLLAQAQTLPPASRVQQRQLDADSIPTFVTFWPQATYAASEAGQALHEQLRLTDAETMVATKTETDDLGLVHTRYQLYYQGAKVEQATYSVHARQGRLESLNGHLRHPGSQSVVPGLPAAKALQRALGFVGARQYMWESAAEEAGLRQRQNNPAASYLPKGELVFVLNSLSALSAKRGQLTLAWKFGITARQPFSSATIYVDAHTGEVVAQESMMESITAPYATRYSSTRTVETDANPGGGFRLRDNTRNAGIITRNSFNSPTIFGALDFTDSDNNWTAAEYNNANLDNAAGDAHFGAEATLDYWRAVHNRNSYDNNGAPIYSYVHFNPDQSNPNARNNAISMDNNEILYGDGTGNFQPFTSLDICAHEIGHNVCRTTANLAYQAESGALNEGFSDIWGACVEQSTAARLGLGGKNTWVLGEEIVNFGGGLRSMSDPRTLGQPAYYKGQNWVVDPGVYNKGNDYGGVHTNSGVLNHWFFVLAQGESGTNEGGRAYAVTGIGISSAARIAYRAESVYLQAASRYEDARRLTLLAAQDIFGVCSPEAVATANAWLAVGLGEGSFIGTPPTPSISSYPMSAANEPTHKGFQVRNPPLGVGFNWYVNGTFYQATDINNFDYYFQCRMTRTITCVLTSCTATSGTSNGITFTGECTRGPQTQTTYAYAPNPASDELVVSAEEPAPASATSSRSATARNAAPPFTAELYNVFGQLVGRAESQANQVRLDLRSLPAGLYTLRAGSGPEALNEHIQVVH